MDRNAGLVLNKEARKLAMRVVREQKNIKEKQKALSTGLKSSDNVRITRNTIVTSL